MDVETNKSSGSYSKLLKLQQEREYFNIADQVGLKSALHGLVPLNVQQEFTDILKRADVTEITSWCNSRSDSASWLLLASIYVPEIIEQDILGINASHAVAGKKGDVSCSQTGVRDTVRTDPSSLVCSETRSP